MTAGDTDVIPSNAFKPIVGATDLLMLIRVNPEQFWNAIVPIEVTEFPIVKDPVKPAQYLNA